MPLWPGPRGLGSELGEGLGLELGSGLALVLAPEKQLLVPGHLPRQRGAAAIAFRGSHCWVETDGPITQRTPSAGHHKVGRQIGVEGTPAAAPAATSSRGLGRWGRLLVVDALGEPHCGGGHGAWWH